MRIKKGDTVKMLSGKSSGKVGKVLKGDVKIDCRLLDDAEATTTGTRKTANG